MFIGKNDAHSRETCKLHFAQVHLRLCFQIFLCPISLKGNVVFFLRFFIQRAPSGHLNLLYTLQVAILRKDVELDEGFENRRRLNYIWQTGFFLNQRIKIVTSYLNNRKQKESGMSSLPGNRFDNGLPTISGYFVVSLIRPTARPPGMLDQEVRQ